ncbi:hypothetical protein, partial [Halorubrum sp. SD626R]|uniref:hypothetical protein n=1 Tax=Halorubrum sp. SD626R TaxID=1419722 RepID=UPI001A7EA662
LYLYSQPSFSARIYLSPTLLCLRVYLVAVVTTKIKLVIALLVSDLPIDALKLVVCDSKISTALFKERVTILWICAWVVITVIIESVNKISTGCERY